MKRFLSISLSIIVWLAILAWLVFATRQCRNGQRAGQLLRTEIEVTDYDRLQIVSSDVVRGWLAEAGVALEGVALESVDTDSIISVIGSQPFVREVKAWTEQSGTLHVNLSQRQPVMRVSRGDGKDFYISGDMWVLPTNRGRAEYVPVVTGEFTMPFEAGWYGELREPDEDLLRSYNFLLKLIDFVKFISADPFWNAEIVQINVREKAGEPEWKEPDIELVPRVGNHIIAMGTMDNAPEKLAKLRLFYSNVLEYEGWDRYRLIDIRYHGQVVCRTKQNIPTS
jgi:cell division protein FtsQ